jgi:hypothetical protein
MTRRHMLEQEMRRVEAGALELDDFDQLREPTRGWDTDPIQLSPRPLRLSHHYFRAADLTVARIRSNQ